MGTIITDVQVIDEILERGTIVEILPTKELFREKLLSGERLRFYIGFDATAPTLHLSHAKNLMLLEKFRLLGHEVIVLFGDFTARIGDPTGTSTTRNQLTREDVQHNVNTWKTLIQPLMNFADEQNPPRILYNHAWLSAIGLEDLLKLGTNFTVQQMLERDMFQKRIEANKPIYLHEFMYPLMQGYDSVAMDVDVELCGTDQIFNALAGRVLQKRAHNKEKFVVAVTLMENPKTGELMSKSKGTGVFLDTTPAVMYGQILAQPDEMMEVLFVNNTHISKQEIGEVLNANDPLSAKMRLAREIVTIYHGVDAARLAEEEFVRVFQDSEVPQDAPVVQAAMGEALVDLLMCAGVVASKGEFRRLIEGNAVHRLSDGETITDAASAVNEPGVYKIGKRRFVRIEVAAGQKA